ncbi:MAG: hypothetical protein KJN63_10290 [Acidimicrobiia bacterium]|nr:hypothetical protein [Acidimicrobiia bacterium]RZV41565.1 MAG: hypothetical protein EX269_16150 [Acidimicrobiales bacterium]
MSDLWDDAETRFIQPYQANKTYLCPGCNRDIPPGLGHMVAIPYGAADLRRHWHRACWTERGRRRPMSS